MAAARRLEKALHEATAAQAVKLQGRKTRGTRMQQLMGEEAEADESFWGQDAWNLDEDSEYSSEEEVKDVFDKDFNDTESEEDEEDDSNEKLLKKREREQKRKESAVKNVYKEPKKSTVLPSAKATAAGMRKRPRPAPSSRSSSAGGESRAVRVSTKAKTEASTQARVEDIKDAQSRPTQKRQPRRHYTQEQLLIEAARTEIKSAAWLEEQKRLAEASKEREERELRSVSSFKQRFLSKRGLGTLIVFSEVDAVPDVLKRGQRVRPPKAPKLCIITGMPAKYRDPQTGLPYATIEAFRELRRRHAARALEAYESRDTNSCTSSSSGSGTSSSSGSSSSTSSGSEAED